MLHVTSIRVDGKGTLNFHTTVESLEVGQLGRGSRVVVTGSGNDVGVDF